MTDSLNTNATLNPEQLEEHTEQIGGNLNINIKHYDKQTHLKRLRKNRHRNHRSHRNSPPGHPLGQQEQLTGTTHLPKTLSGLFLKWGA